MRESRAGFGRPSIPSTAPRPPAFPEALESPAGKMRLRLTSHFLCRLCSNNAIYLPYSTSFFSVCLDPFQSLRETGHRALLPGPARIRAAEIRFPWRLEDGAFVG